MRKQKNHDLKIIYTYIFFHRNFSEVIKFIAHLVNTTTFLPKLSAYFRISMLKKRFYNNKLNTFLTLAQLVFPNIHTYIFTCVIICLENIYEILIKIFNAPTKLNTFFSRSLRSFCFCCFFGIRMCSIQNSKTKFGDAPQPKMANKLTITRARHTPLARLCITNV